VFATLVDFTKAFDRVNYWILFGQLPDDGVDVFCSLIAYWYANQQAYVRWNNTVSSKFHIFNGTKQGVISSYLFTRYVRSLLAAVAQCGVGCCVGGLFTNIFSYADII